MARGQFGKPRRGKLTRFHSIQSEVYRNYFDLNVTLHTKQVHVLLLLMYQLLFSHQVASVKAANTDK